MMYMKQIYLVCGIVTMFALADIFRSSGRVVPPLAAGRSPTDEY